MFKKKLFWKKIKQIQIIDDFIKKHNKEIEQIEIDGNSYDEEWQNIVNKIYLDYENFSFANIPSVELSKYKEITLFDNDFEKRIKFLSKISLMEHIDNLIDLINKEKKIKDNEYKTLYLLALLHDAGKSKKLREYYNISDKITHEKASALYAKKILENTKWEFVANILFQAINFKNGKIEDTSNEFYKLLVYYDKKARKLELSKLKNK